MAATKKRSAVGASSSSMAGSKEKKTNPFEQRANHRARHPALNRKVKGANRNVGLARSKAAEKRENELLPDFKRRKVVSEIVDKRFGEGKGGERLTHEEKMLKRFQTVRSKKRAGRFHLGDDAGGLEDGDDDDEGSDAGNVLTHQGKSLSEVLDEENVMEESSDEEDVDELIERLKSGESFNAVSSEPKKHMTKKEAMLDVIRKSKILKMERQKEKEEDEDERDRVDALMRDVVVAGGLTFRPTGEAKRIEEAQNKSMDEYEKMVRELQMDRGPRAAATNRTKSAEEMAADELKELERLENERIKRMEGDGSDEEEDLDDLEDDKGKKRKQKKTKKAEREEEEEEPEDIPTDLPFLIQCPHTHMELLEFLAAHPAADLNLVLQRIRKTTSVHLKAENRQKLAKLMDVLLDHLALVGERRAQLPFGNQSSQVADTELPAMLQHMYAIAKDVPKETSTLMFNRLELVRRTFENHLQKATSLPSSVALNGGDYGSATCEFAKSSVERKMPGGHKDGLAEALNAEMARLAHLRGDDELASSPTRCWPSGGDFAFYVALGQLYSTTDQRHPLVSSAALLLARSLLECPIRGERDVVAAIQTAQLLERLIRRNEAGANRFAPEAFLLLRVILRQLALETPTEAQQGSDRLFRLDSAGANARSAFDFLRNAKVAPAKKAKSSKKSQAKQQAASDPSALRGFFSYVPELRAEIEMSNVRNVCLSTIVELIGSCARSVDIIPSADILLGELISLIKAIKSDEVKELLSGSLAVLEKAVNSVLTGRKPLRLQEFAPLDKSLAPRFLVDSNTAKRPGEPERVLKRQIKRERKGVARELRLDGQFLAEVRSKEKFSELQQARAKRQQNFRDLEGQQAQFNRMVRDGFAIKGAGKGGLSLKGRKAGRKMVAEE